MTAARDKNHAEGTLMSGLAAAMERVDERIRRAGGDPSEITIVAVTKRQPASAVVAACAAGLPVGEDRVDELNDKALAAPDACWHYLGAVQRRGVKRIVPPVALWQSIDRPAVARYVSSVAPHAEVLIQVNLTGAPNRLGCGWWEAEALAERCVDEGLIVRGLMGVGDPDDPRPGFRRLARLARQLGVDELSMGMSGDFEAAVAEGATILRLGTVLFGPRPTT